ncbi:cupin-like domain-containing protein [Aliiglaciecola sp. 3_MG-2023]|uniref:cupin-like domain-containing protein n=1 Tax=Aliiglaciecola sp. 3_MG-2023 TaxID=3062644 RepID=UPI0026E32E45|nr:cupin-like domain-containing protein [Aliiglaciecola sp. 3_MG-2023]MDO6694142.1 cupin-like domain-containing protein [Aliiglaciecola sp. 3_MG-2023]
MNLPFTSNNNIKEIRNSTVADLNQGQLSSSHPCVFRGLVSHWPIVHAAEQSTKVAVDYLQQWANDNPVQAFEASAEVAGRFFYNDNLQGFNFHPKTTTFNGVMKQLIELKHHQKPPSVYLGSTSINHILPGFRQHNDLEALQDAPLVSIWAGNRSRIAAHYDIPDNLACNVAGRRRFTLFPPDQLANLYIGPLDYTPAGQSASLVDFQQPDFTKFPQFAEAIKHCFIVELEPGDAIFIPSMWWHHVEGLTDFNVLVNYWWRQVPDFMGTPLDALNHAILAIRDLPESQRKVWQDVFQHYVFAPADNAHIPASKKGILNPLDERLARQLRSQLLNKLNR